MKTAVNIAGIGWWQVAAELIGGAVDVGEPLVGQGLDSLASMELRQKLQVGAESLECGRSTVLCDIQLPACSLTTIHLGLWYVGLQ